MSTLVCPRWCESCGDPASVTGLCSACRRRLVPARSTSTDVAAFSYAGEVAPVVLRRFKFFGARDLAPWMSVAAAAAVRRSWRRFGPWPSDTVLCPVPLSRVRRRERGYNQAQLIADGLGQRLGHPVRQLLRRVDGPGRQSRRGRRERKLSSKTEFAPRPGSAYLPVVIVDDVRTTGATLDACSGALEAVGHRVVATLTVFRTPGRRQSFTDL